MAKAESTDDRELIQKADELYEAGEWRQIYELLGAHRDSSNPDVLWRLARSVRDASQLADTSKEEKKRLTYEQVDISRKAVELGPNNYACHQWCGISLSDVGDYEGSKAKINDAYRIREHFVKAVELKPEDPLSHYLLGKWCFEVTDMPWLVRKIASVLFATPPTSTFEEALNCFDRAEKNAPNFYCDNQLMLGKTHLKLGHKEEAREWLTKALKCDSNQPEDVKSKDEAKELLRL
ncbi:regulator of microtubule dynamics protein 1-like [Corticium candelabrum]|uniref:regulator of microtubule dynamics protein 1-like n=1 Tax=Corticium candelabrum TaxID=121492 RepID=UPI002E26D917|nr:regulator of microtubule dynamics protein 1-like [Corticium candelabrum]